MTNLEYFEMIEHRVNGCAPEYIHSMYMTSIARSLAVIADKLTSNETMTPNEYRQIIGLKPVDEVDEAYLQGTCETCKYESLNEFEDPCKSCIESTEISPKWEPKEVEE